MKNYFSVFLVLGLLISCKSEKHAQSTVNNDLNIVFLDSVTAAKTILQDRTDGYFEYLSLADMSIQLKKSDIPNNGGEVKEMYQDLLRSEMTDFTEDDITFLNEVFTKAKAAIDTLNPALWPDNINLLKTKLNHYGPEVYYTREEGIIMPLDIFKEKNVKIQTSVMLHEIFHILSRYNPELRHKLYDLIGFEKLDGELRLPNEVANKILTNPDAVSRSYVIDLVDQEGTHQIAMPLLTSPKERYDTSMPSFFAYLQFDLYPLIQISDNEYTLGLNNEGKSALSVEHHGDFFTQIKDNTQYIIHPEEIMADNFMMAILAYESNNYENFSEQGKKLIMQVTEILKGFKQN